MAYPQYPGVNISRPDSGIYLSIYVNGVSDKYLVDTCATVKYKFADLNWDGWKGSWAYISKTLVKSNSTMFNYMNDIDNVQVVKYCHIHDIRMNPNWKEFWWIHLNNVQVPVSYSKPSPEYLLYSKYSPRNICYIVNLPPGYFTI